MLKADLYRIGKYAMELYQMMDKFEGQGEVDLPHWWQSKIIKSESMIILLLAMVKRLMKLMLWLIFQH